MPSLLDLHGLTVNVQSGFTKPVLLLVGLMDQHIQLAILYHIAINENADSSKYV